MNTRFVTELFHEFQERKSRNPSYSERAFARTVGLSPGFLKLLFQRKKRLSVERAREVARRLSWTENKTSSLTQLSAESDAQKVSQLDFNEISDWYHFAVIELLKTSEKGFTREEICKKLGLSTDEATDSLRKLEQLKFIQIDDRRAKATVDQYEVPALSSAEIRKFHRQTLNKALEALDHQAFERRDFKALTLAFDPARMNEVEKFFAKFIQDFEKEFGSGNLNCVYQLNLAFFQLDKEKTK